MMQYDRRQAGASRTAKNFISKNKSSVKDKSRKELEIAKKGQGRPRPAGQQDKKNTNAANSKADTVTISKDYLQRLLKSNVMKEHVDDFNSLPVSLAPLSSPPPPMPAHFNASPRRSHDYDRTEQRRSHGYDRTEQRRSHDYDRGQIEAHNGMERSPNAAARQNNRTAHDQWVDDIAVQVQERQKEKERLKREKKNEKVEEYFPFGRPGCGAPIRSETGRILTDYQERANMYAPEKGQRHQHIQYSPPSYRQQYAPPAQRHGRQYSPSPPPYNYRRSPSPPPPRRGYKQRSPSPPYQQHYRRSPSPKPHHYYGHHRGYERSPSPQSPPPVSTYHRGTTNRPVHPSMRSSIPFGPSSIPGGSVRERRVEKTKPRERTRKIDDTAVPPSHTGSDSHRQHKASHYGRGAGPHVNEYVLQEKNDRMKIDEQHKAFLKRQILEKQRQKEAERLRKEREDREDDMRLQQERAQIEKAIQRDRQREKDKAEAEARRQEFMQEKIRLATEAAIRAKEEAKRLKAKASPRKMHQNSVPVTHQHELTASYHRSEDEHLHDIDTATTTVSHERVGHQNTSRQPQAVVKNRKTATMKETGQATTGATRNRAGKTQVESGNRRGLRVSAHQTIPQRRSQRPDNDRASNSKTTLPNSVARTGNNKSTGAMSKPSRVQQSSDHTAVKTNLPHLQPPASPPVPAIARKLGKSSQEPPKRQVYLPPIAESSDKQQHSVNHPVQPVASSESSSPPPAADALSYGYSYGSQSLQTPSTATHTTRTMDGGLPPLIKLDNRASADLEAELQSHAQKLKEQDRLIKMLEQQLKEEQQRQQRQRDQQQVLKELASLKMGILQCRTK